MLTQNSTRSPKFSEMVRLKLLSAVLAIHLCRTLAIWDGKKTKEVVKYQVILKKCNYVIGGGSILASNLILTAAYAVRNVNPTQIKVLVGTNTVDTRVRAGKEYDVKSIHSHHLYSSLSRLFDIAVVVLKNKITRLDLIFWRPVKLVSIGNTPAEGTTLTVRGLGKVNEALKRAKITRETTVKVRSTDVCKESFEKFGRIYSDRVVFCAGTDTTMNVCHGDVGNPIVDSNDVQVGIVSLDVACGTTWIPGHYTNIADPFIMTWIESWKRIKLFSLI